jgi:hypothetical protein
MVNVSAFARGVWMMIQFFLITRLKWRVAGTMQALEDFTL